MKCHFCEKIVSICYEMVDVGGLKLCIDCFVFRKNRKSIPCEVCNTAVLINNPSILACTMACSGCRSKANLRQAWDNAKNKNPCDRCGNTHSKYHHASCWGQNLCHDCYSKTEPCTQMYPGDLGYPAFFCKPSVPAALLPFAEKEQLCNVVVCVVCGDRLSGPFCKELIGLPTICQNCDGEKWWAQTDNFR